ncbi:MAG TPA: TolC family protein [Verrucomicrobiae bacterium]|nr:TolC family protein [Verrucomicrobiae bacterium]
MKKLLFGFALATFAFSAGAQNAGTNSAWISQPLSLLQSLNIALQQNAAILKAKNDLQSQYGVVVQTRAVALPQITASGQYVRKEQQAIESFPGASQPPNQNWNGGVQIVQTIFDGGRMVAALKAASATKKQSLAQYQATVADALLSVRIAYYDILLSQEQIKVHEASVNLLQKELEDQQNRFNAGTVPRFNVLRAEVAVANERPNLIQARNNFRIAKNNLSNLLGYNLPRDIWEDVPLNLSDSLDSAPYDVNLPDAIQEALGQRSELVALREAEKLQKLNIVNARAGYQPTLQVFAGYSWNNSQFIDPNDLGYTLHGWNAGAQVSWNLFDGLLTHGKVVQAKAQYERSKTDLIDESRQIELQVRTAYSQFIEAQEVLQSQEKVQEEAEEALREAEARASAGTGTQLDVLDAQTSLTQARATKVQALHDYDAARAKLQRAIGQDMVQTAKAE